MRRCHESLFREFACVAAAILLCRAAVADVILPQAFSGVQGSSGIFYEAVGDSRSTNTLNPAPAGATLLNYLGSFSFGYPGDVALPTYASPGGFPNVQHVTAYGFLLIHPGTGGFIFGSGTADRGVGVRFQAPVAGQYMLVGDFARLNVNQGYGNGVDVRIVKNLDLDHPLFAANITSNHFVNYATPFSGTGVVSFNLNVSLAAGDSVRFIVFSDGQGQDGTFDGTAFRTSITQVTSVPEPPTMCTFALAMTALIAHRRRRRNSIIKPSVTA